MAKYSSGLIPAQATDRSTARPLQGMREYWKGISRVRLKFELMEIEKAPPRGSA